MSLSPHILIIEDDRNLCLILEEALKEEGWRLSIERDLSNINKILEKDIDLVLCDVLTPSGNSLDQLAKLKQNWPNLPFIIMSAHSNLETALRANQEGAHDYIAKPFDLNHLIQLVKTALKKPILPQDDLKILTRGLIGSAPSMQRFYRDLVRIAPTDLTVLITGESGTGKELAARTIHENSKRAKGPFVAVNMAAIPTGLIETTLFGHEKGAFTGASARQVGSFEEARNGTIFLDEIGDMPLEAQTRLLRVLQEGEFRPIGRDKAIKSDLRILAATHKDMRRLVAEGHFRQDLYFRLDIVPLHLPPLRERLDDIPLLSEQFLKKAARQGLGHKRLTESAIKRLQEHSWPGNVREFENMIQRLCALSSAAEIGLDAVERLGGLDFQALPINRNPKTVKLEGNLTDSLKKHLEAYFDSHGDELPPAGLYGRILKDIERPLIAQALKATRGNQLKAADLLGLNRNTLHKKIRELELDLSLYK